jgi:hypothetical protein
MSIENKHRSGGTFEWKNADGREGLRRKRETEKGDRGGSGSGGVVDEADVE